MADTMAPEAKMDSFLGEYFSVEAYTNETNYGFQDGFNTHYDLRDEHTVLRDYESVMQDWQVTMFQWVNQADFCPYEYTDKFEHEVVLTEFGQNEFPEPAPHETTPRYITMSKRVVIETSERHNLGFPFENQRMATPAGQRDFKLFSARCSFMFTELVSRLTLLKVLNPDVVDSYYYNPSKATSLQAYDTMLNNEIYNFGRGNFDQFGFLPLVHKMASVMHQVNVDDGWPTHCLYNQEKDATIRFNDKVSQFINMGDESFISAYDIKFRHVPKFSTLEAANTEDIGSMLSTRVEIGNSFPMRNTLMKYGKRSNISIKEHGTLGVFSENDDGLRPIDWIDVNERDSRWGDDGYLHGDHEEKDKDMYTYLDTALGKHVPCRIIGDMKTEKLPESILIAMVDCFLRGDVTESTLSNDLKILRNHVARNGTAATLDAIVLDRLRELSMRLFTLGGREKNPLFTRANMECDSGSIGNDRVFRRVMMNLFKIPLPDVFFRGDNGGRPDNAEDEPNYGEGLDGPDFGEGLDEPDSSAGFGDSNISIEGNCTLDSNIVNRLIGRVNDALRTNDQLKLALKAAPHLKVRFEGFLKLLERYRDKLVDVNLSTENFEAIRNAFDHLLTVWTEMRRGTARVKSKHLNRMLIKFDKFVACLMGYNNVVSNPLGKTIAEILAANGFGMQEEPVSNAPQYDEDGNDLHVGSVDACELMYQALVSGVLRVGVNPNPVIVAGFRMDESQRESIEYADAINIEVAPKRTPGLLKRYHFIDSWNSEESGNFYDDDGEMKPRKSAKRYRDDYADTVGDHANIALNSERVEHMFTSELRSGIGALILLIPIHRDVFRRLLQNDIFIPCEYVLIRNQMAYEMEGVCLVQAANGGVGKAYLGYPAAEIGKSAMDMTGMVHLAQYVSIVVPQERRRWKIPTMWYRRAFGGASAELWNIEDWNVHRENNYLTVGEYERPSIHVCSVPVGSYIAKRVHVSGKFHEDEQRYSYDSWQFYGTRLGFSDFDTDNVFIHQRMESGQPNGLCMWGTFAVRGLDGKWQDVSNNYGHHKKEQPMVKEIRQFGLSIVNTNVPLLVQ